MKVYFSTKQIPQLMDLPLSQRLDLLRKAENKLSVPEKLLLNICKLIIIIPVFALLLRTGEDWVAPLWAMLFMLAYPLILKPFQYSLCVKYLPTQQDQGNS
jgi:hypothetical protein